MSHTNLVNINVRSSNFFVIGIVGGGNFFIGVDNARVVIEQVSLICPLNIFKFKVKYEIELDKREKDILGLGKVLTVELN